MGKLFVTVFAFCSCSQDKFLTILAPGHAHLHAIKILHRDSFLASIKIVPRHVYNSQALYPDWKNMRHRYPKVALNTKLRSPK